MKTVSRRYWNEEKRQKGSGKRVIRPNGGTNVIREHVMHCFCKTKFGTKLARPGWGERAERGGEDGERVTTLADAKSPRWGKWDSH